ncbi:MAG: glycosyltransferase family 39 protein, partial [Bryobacterales bacterium]|nr:glycosyltransferase family 39 protein [Bryobacterales bacterium]
MSRVAWIVAVSLVLAVYLSGLTGMGLVGPDEPRYASIGREMARSGDWVTPRLWGEPWFEKPALLYWMTASALRIGIEGELAARLPVALLSVAFLALFFFILREKFGERAAWYGSVTLATSAGWLGYSHVAVFDLPLAATFGAAMLLSLDWIESGNTRRLPAASALLGAATLAKGLAPLVLILPLLWCGRRRIRDLFAVPVIGAFLAVAVPWYAACWWANGTRFPMVFFVEHHLGRYVSSDLQHVQPFWYYAWVMPAALFPWTPAVAGLFRRAFYADPKRKFLLGWCLWSILFFSLSTNKLPSYVLPALPAAAALMGVALAEKRNARWTLAGVAAGLIVAGPLAGVLPQALAGGIGRAAIPAFEWHWLWPLPAAAVVWVLEDRGLRNGSLAVLACVLAAGIFLLKARAIPAIDAGYSARPVWREVERLGVARDVCVAGLHRGWRYGLNYYSIVPWPECTEAPQPSEIRQLPGRPPYLAV